MFIFYGYGILGLMDPTPHPLSSSPNKPSLALALPAAGKASEFNNAQNTSHLEKYAFNKEEVPSK